MEFQRLYLYRSGRLEPGFGFVIVAGIVVARALLARLVAVVVNKAGAGAVGVLVDDGL